MEHQKMKELISFYFDGELNKEQRKQVKEHLNECSECRAEFEGINKLEEIMSKVEFKKPSKDVWKIYWYSVYNRLERRLGWILLSIGAIILLFFGAYKMIEGIIQDSTTPLVLKVGILVFIGGVVVMLVSLIRERFFIRKRERYKEVEK